MDINYAPSFLRIYKKFHEPIKEGIRATTKDIIDYYTSGHKTPGLGIRHLRNDIWEGRFRLHLRVVYLLGRNNIKFLVAGTHKDVHNFLRRL